MPPSTICPANSSPAAGTTASVVSWVPASPTEPPLAMSMSAERMRITGAAMAPPMIAPLPAWSATSSPAMILDPALATKSPSTSNQQGVDVDGGVGGRAAGMTGLEAAAAEDDVAAGQPTRSRSGEEDVADRVEGSRAGNVEAAVDQVDGGGRRRGR